MFNCIIILENRVNFQIMKRSRAIMDLSSLKTDEDCTDNKRCHIKSDYQEKFFDFEYCRIDHAHDVLSCHLRNLNNANNIDDDDDDDDYTDSELSTLDNSSTHNVGSLSSSIVSSSDSLIDYSSRTNSNEQHDLMRFTIKKPLLPNDTLISIQKNNEITDIDIDKKLSNLTCNLLLKKDEEEDDKNEDENEKNAW